jgi:squalene-hopene/tetraprenyl-beta-curcumene cyclase
MALGRSHLATRYAARLLREQQNLDGGWGTTAGSRSTAAATGMALALLSQYLPADHPMIEAGVEYLLTVQEPSGAWAGATDMFAPRPFAVDYPFQTHALAAMGIIAVANKERRSGRERRRLRFTGDFLAVTLTEE